MPDVRLPHVRVMMSEVPPPFVHEPEKADSSSTWMGIKAREDMLVEEVARGGA